MKTTSLLKLLAFLFAAYANVRYASFLLNPSHAANLVFYLFVVIADVIAMVVMSYTWISSLYFELQKSNYYRELEDLKQKGKGLVETETAILVPVVKEAYEIVEKTLQKIMAMRGDKKIYLLDDAHRSELKDLAQEYNVTYITRDNNNYFKAGNLNNALGQVKEKFVAVFDADFMPEKSFLEETLPFFIDETVGAVQTPQLYYNEENLFSKGCKNFQTIFYDYVMPSKHMVHSSFCVGTNVVYRKEALTKIGGIAKVSHSEDVFTALKLAENGYRIFYVNKALAYGLAPSNVVSFFNQQARWSRGGFSMLFKHNTLFNRKLTWDQRIQFFFSNFFYLTGISIFIYVLNPIIAIIFNVRPFVAEAAGDWAISYVLFFISNVVFYMLFVRKSILQSSALGLLCFVPYITSFFSVVLNQKFDWKPTNFMARDLVTKILSPFIIYLILSFSVLYLLGIRALEYESSISVYIFWMCIYSVISIYLMINAYTSIFGKSKAKTIRPERRLQYGTVA